LAISEDKNLWRNAFEEKVFIVGAQTLMAALRIIDLTWVNVQQQKNIHEILITARQLIDRVNSFQKNFADIKKKIEALSESYEKVTISVEGQKGILSSGRKLENLGVKGTKALPKSDDSYDEF
jgi:DNA recombination protein RmuC